MYLYLYIYIYRNREREIKGFTWERWIARERRRAEGGNEV